MGFKNMHALAFPESSRYGWSSHSNKKSSLAVKKSNKRTSCSYAVASCRGVSTGAQSDQARRKYFNSTFIQEQKVQSSLDQSGRRIFTAIGNWAFKRRELRRRRELEREILRMQSVIEPPVDHFRSADENDHSNQYEYKITIEKDNGLSKNLLSQKHMQALHQHLPPNLQKSCKAQLWKCLYSILRDGDSFDTFLTLLAPHQQTLLVIQTTDGGLLGGFVEQSWENSSSGTNMTGISVIKHNAQEFYGSGRAFVFCIPESDEVKVFPWTGKNRYIQYCNASSKTIAMGGGGENAAFGFIVQNEFTNGSTGCCDTFDNTPLVNSNANETHANSHLFEVLDMEVWGFVGSI